MKKIISVLLTVLTLISLTACTGGQDAGQKGASGTGTITNSVSAENTSTENTLAENNSTENASSQNASSGDMAQTKSSEIMSEAASGNGQTEGGAKGTKILVAYFSATNTTKGVAENIAGSLSADLYQIVPEQPYTAADLDYRNNNSRSTIEMNDKSARPAISGSVGNMGQYDIVFIGYPIWWGEAPRIISTFMENYDFSGKTIVPFCTSGSSGVGSSAANLEALTSGATWLSGTRLNGGISRSETANWINGLGLNITAQ